MAESIVKFPKYGDENGVLCVFESGVTVPFKVLRVFTVSGKAGDIRGDHAHKLCSQLLICVSGKIRVTCDDGFVVTNYMLDSTDKGLLVPPGIWAREEYLMNNAVLMVLCDRGYEAEDYLRNYNDFKIFIGI